MSNPKINVMTTKPPYHDHEEFQNRTQKLAEIRELGVEPFPHKFIPTAKADALHKSYDQKEIGHSEEAQAGKTPTATVAGRLVLFRSMGKNAFAHIQDSTGRIQVMFTRDETTVDGFTPSEALSNIKFIEKKIDLGDIIGVEGHLFHTNKGELTLFANKVTLLTKTLLPLADKHAGLHDKETRYRKRWLDLISNEEVRDTFKKRSEIFRLLRAYMTKNEFMEVETPVLQSIYGGAEARPFITKLNALDQEMFLRISLEIPLKKLIVGGMDRVFEIGRVFRNEGIDRTHNPEFTMIEAYASYWDYNDMMKFVEELFQELALTLYGMTKLKVQLSEKEDDIVEIDVKAPWKRMTMKDALKTYVNLDVDTLTDEQMRQMLREDIHCDNAKLKGMSRGLLIGALFGAKAERFLVQPHHIIDHPRETTPLCKWHRDPSCRKDTVERFESFILGQEMCNAYSELNDPQLQRSLLEEQSARRDAGDEEASPFDEEFIEAICQGMPPTGGVGIGLDRLVMLFTNSHTIRDVLFFPWMKPLEE